MFLSYYLRLILKKKIEWYVLFENSTDALYENVIKILVTTTIFLKLEHFLRQVEYRLWNGIIVILPYCDVLKSLSVFP